MRFFRLSQLSDDIFDAYRNAFLALEAVLFRRIGPIGSAAWRARLAWVRVDACTEPAWGGPAGSYLINAARANPVEQFLEEQYRDASLTPFFHAKSGRGALLPGVAADRREVSAGTQSL